MVLTEKGNIFFCPFAEWCQVFFLPLFRRENLANFSKEQQEKGRKGELVSHSSRKRKRREEKSRKQFRKRLYFFRSGFLKGKAKLLNPAAHFLSKSVFLVTGFFSPVSFFFFLLLSPLFSIRIIPYFYTFPRAMTTAMMFNFMHFENARHTNTHILSIQEERRRFEERKKKSRTSTGFADFLKR